MKEQVKPMQADKEFFITEGCHIIELLQAEDDPYLSIARARLEPGMTTRWHRLTGLIERYVILEGRGLVEVGQLPAQEVLPGDVILIPAECRQRISNTGQSALLFLAICTPPFKPENYEDIEEPPISISSP